MAEKLYYEDPFLVEFTARPGLPNAIDHVSGQMDYSLQMGATVPYLRLELVTVAEAPRDFDQILQQPAGLLLMDHDCTSG